MSTSADERAAAPPAPARARSPWLAGLLSLLMPGLGHLYIGRARQAVVLFVLLVAVTALLGLVRIGLLPRFWMAAAALALYLALVLYAIIDAVRQAWRSGPYVRKSYNRWYVYVGVYLLMSLVTGGAVAALAASGSSGYFDTPSSSMEPTIRRGEHILADTRWYRHHAPARGDIAIYKLPRDPEVYFVKRIVAVAGDRVSVKDGRAYVNGAPVAEPYANFGDPKAFLNNTPEFVVPAGHVFVLGDNRGNSTDSRLASTHGYVPVANLTARVTDIAVSSELGRLGRWIGTPSQP